jgi:hypothetical protein
MWAQLLRRVFHVDALRCPQCSSSLVVLAFLTDPEVVTKLLLHLRLPASAPRVSGSRVESFSAQRDLFGEGAEQRGDRDLPFDEKRGFGHFFFRTMRPCAERAGHLKAERQKIWVSHATEPLLLRCIRRAADAGTRAGHRCVRASPENPLLVGAEQGCVGFRRVRLCSVGPHPLVCHFDSRADPRRYSPKWGKGG